MKAVGYFDAKPIEDADSLIDLEIGKPLIEPLDLLVEVKAVSVNPVDYKVRASRQPEAGQPIILGWDAAGIVVDVGESVQGFKPGDQVYYAGDLMRQGSNAQFHAVDSRLVGRMPKTLSFSQAAALPLTSLTAYEGLFGKIKVPMDQEFNLLLIASAGGVSSIAIQLIKALTNGKVFVTYGCESSKERLQQLGADGLLNRQQSLLEGLKNLQLPYFDSIFSATHTKEFIPEFYRIIRPFGDVCLIDDPDILATTSLKNEAVNDCQEFMFAKPPHKYEMKSQGEILNLLADLIDGGKVQSTTTTVLNGLTAENFKKAHSMLKAGTSIGKIVVEY